MLPLLIPQSILDDMVAHARDQAPYECCGLLAGMDGAVARHYPINNTVAQDQQAVRVFEEANVKQLGDLSGNVRAEVAYFMDPKEMLAAFKDMRRQGFDLLVIYHSHTRSAAYPSDTDIGLAHYPEAMYLIISIENRDQPDLRAYWINNKQVLPAEFKAS